MSFCMSAPVECLDVDARVNPVSIDGKSVRARVNDRLNAAAVFLRAVRHDDISPYVQELSLGVQAAIGPVLDLGDT